MKYVKCIYEGRFLGSPYSDLTLDKIYEVINHNSDTKPHNNPTYTGSIWNESIDIINDKNELRNYYLIDTDGRWFEDVTSEIRNNKLEQLGI